ncbi:putative membrane protein [Wolbachia endosymbiont of Trichogramma pretiosum]|nr:putative membrane protein [Wolbachia endosymbiont of Trichogramma pretiosum]
MGDIEATELIKFGEMSMIIMNVIVHHYILLSGISSLK